MKKQAVIHILLFIIVLFLVAPVHTAAATEMKTLIYDEANLLSEEQFIELNKLANEYGALRETDFIIYTSNNIGK